MATFAAHVTVHGESGPVHFAPGDELPEWAEGLVGKHCLEAEAEIDAPDFTAPENPPAGDADGDTAAEGDVDADVSGEEEPEAPTDAPDFTAPAPRRGRNAKS
ncbi:hypothetical protein [Arthrobacter sp. ok362]|uniref:hypothetical protein n=1 Tax=Arthrobacter sp. ok362 TaxID=1761745 RepID=UPI000880D5C4|nr:hypothetical protein [Arthrobacter sp. ok362]SDK79312.1 hypothetical protein SAMN04487913_103200 [Arthrobacter sp. ok362]